MANLVTSCKSFTGQTLGLYSDTYYRETLHADDDCPGKKCKVKPQTTVMPTLNRLARIPVFGRLAGITRVVLSIIHVIGHTIAALVCWDVGHFKHVAKGGTELLRGVIESIPVIGFFFAWNIDARRPWCNADSDVLMDQCKYNDYAGFFLIKITDPNHFDAIDRVFARRPGWGVPSTS